MAKQSISVHDLGGGKLPPHVVTPPFPGAHKTGYHNTGELERSVMLMAFQAVPSY